MIGTQKKGSQHKEIVKLPKKGLSQKSNLWRKVQKSQKNKLRPVTELVRAIFQSYQIQK